MKRKIYLSGAELEAHLLAEAEAAELAAKHQAVLERSRRMLHADGDSDDSDSDADEEEVEEEEDGAAPEAVRRRTGGFTGGAGAWDEFLDESTLIGRAGGQSFDIYVKGEYGVRRVMEGLPRYRMFPVVERKRRVDAYGEAIDVEGWLRRGVEDEALGGLGGGAKLGGGAQAVLGKRPREEEEKEEVGFFSFALEEEENTLADARYRSSPKRRTNSSSRKCKPAFIARSLSSIWKEQATVERSRLSFHKSTLVNSFVLPLSISLSSSR